jgi:hypothetical protein
VRAIIPSDYFIVIISYYMRYLGFIRRGGEGERKEEDREGGIT